jgi:hypothetical protein
MCPDVKAPAALRQYRSGRNDLGGEQTWRPEHYEISASSKTTLREVEIRGAYAGSRPTFSWGRPMTLWKKQVRAHGGTAGVGDPASKERLSEVTSGSSHGQQGLRTTCKDFSNEAKC